MDSPRVVHKLLLESLILDLVVNGFQRVFAVPTKVTILTRNADRSFMAQVVFEIRIEVAKIANPTTAVEGLCGTSAQFIIT